MNNKNFIHDMVALIIPITIQSFMMALVSATDAIMLGLLDQVSLSSVSMAGQVQFIFSLIVSGIAIGLGIMAAQYWGKNDRATIEKILPISLKFNLLIGLGFTAAALLIPNLIMSFLTNEPALITAGSGYLRTVALSYVLCGVSQVYLNAMKNIGMAKDASLISSMAVVFNIVADAVLIFGFAGIPAMGIAGAAIATVMARAIELIWCVLKLRDGRVLTIRYDLMFKENEYKDDFWYYTWPVLMASLVWGVAFMMYSVIMGHLGSDAVAAYSIASVAKQLVSCLVKGLGTAAGIYIGNLMGANKMDDAKHYAKKLTITAAAMGFVTGVVLVAISPFVISVVEMSEVAKGYLKYMLWFSAINVWAQAVNITVLDGIFCAGGDSRFDMIGNIGAMWCFSLPAGFLAAFVLKLPVIIVFVIVNLDEIVKLPAVFARYRKYIWLKNITREA